MVELRLIDVDYDYIEPPTLTREIVEEEADAAVLLEWFRLLESTSEEMTIMTRSLRQGGARSHAIATKLGYVNIALHWVRNRLIELDEIPDNAPNSIKVKRLQAHNAKLVIALEKARQKQANTVAMIEAERRKRAKAEEMPK